MGYLLGEEDGITSTVFHPESRRESFIVHYDSRNPHPEWLWTDLDELIEVLETLRTFAHNQGLETRKVKPPTLTLENVPRDLVIRGSKQEIGEAVGDYAAFQRVCQVALEAEENTDG